MRERYLLSRPCSEEEGLPDRSAASWHPVIACVAVAILAFQASALGGDAGTANVPEAVPNGIAAATSLPRFRVVERLDVSDVAFPAPGEVAWSPDGRELAASVDFGGTLVRVWNRGGKLIRELHRQDIGPPSGAPPFLNGSRDIVTEPVTVKKDDTVLSVTDIATGAVVQNVAGVPPCTSPRPNYFSDVAVSPDQSFVAVSCGFDLFAPVVVYSVRDWRPVAVLRETSEENSAHRADIPTALAFSRDGRAFAVGTEQCRLLVYDTSSWRIVHAYAPFRDVRHVSGLDGISFSPDSKSAVVMTSDNSSVPLLPDGTMAPGRGIMTHIAVATPIRVIRISDGKLIAAAMGVGQPAREAKWDPASLLIVLVDPDHQVEAWLPGTGSLPMRIQSTGPAASVDFSPDGSLLAVTEAKRITIFRIDFR